MGRLLVVTLCVSCVLVACGGRDSSPTASGTTTTKAKSTVGTPVKIDAPKDGKRVRARETKSGAWLARVKVRGTAAPNSTVYLRAGCQPKACVEETTAAADGTWSASLRVRTRPSLRFVTVDAGPEAIVGSGSSVVTVELFGPQSASGSSKPEATTGRELPHEVLLIGDSLAVGMESALKSELRGWSVEVDGLKSRRLKAGMRILARQPKPSAIVAFSLFTNDDPRDLDQLDAAVRATAARSDGCAVWGTIARPPSGGTSYARVNRRLKQRARQEQFAQSLQIADWARAVASEPSLLASDGLNATPQGYVTLAGLYADAIRACAEAGT